MTPEYFYILSFIFLVTEVCVFAWLELKLWKTLYTPLCFLMFPYMLVLISSIIIVNYNHLYPFYSESIFVWILGLLFFAVPSWVTAYLYSGNRNLESSVTDVEFLPKLKYIVFISLPLLFIFSYHLKSVLSASTVIEGLGSDEFAENAMGGVWGHIFKVVLALEMLFIYFLSKKRWYLFLIVILCLGICVVNQVKGWIMIPIFSGILLKIITGKLKLSYKIIIFTIIFGALFFFLSYYLSIVVSEGHDMDNKVTEFIGHNFMHYLSSGVLGLSMDMDQGIHERQNVEYLFTPFANIIHLFTGEEMLSNLNTYFMYTTWNGLGTNIRTFMGTIYVFGRGWSPLIVIFWSSLAYIIRICYLSRKTISLLLTDAWMSALFMMGWFDYYFALLAPFEVIAIFFIMEYTIYFFNKNEAKKQTI